MVDYTPTDDELNAQVASGSITQDDADQIRARNNPQLDAAPMADANAGGFTQALPTELPDRRDTAKASMGSVGLGDVAYANIDPANKSTAVPPQPATPPPSPPIDQSQIPQQSGMLDEVDQRLQNTQGQIAAQLRQANKASATAADMQNKALTDAADLGAQKAAETAAFQRRASAEQAAQIAAMNKAENERKQAVATKQTEYENDAAEVNSMKIDPDSRSLAQRIGGAIAIGLGAYASAVTGAPNAALQLVQKQIENNIQVQRDNINNKRAGLQAKHTQLQDLRDRYGDERIADNVAYARGLTLADNKLAALQAEYGPGEAQNKIDQLRSQVQQSRADHIMEATKIYGAAMTASQTDEARLAIAGARGKPTTGKPLPAGQVKAISDLQASINGIDDLDKRFTTQTGPASFIAQKIPGTGAYDFNARVNINQTLMRRAMDGLRVNKLEMQQALAMFPTASTWHAGGHDKLMALRQTLVDHQQTALEGFKRAGYNIGTLDQGQSDPSKYGATPAGQP